MIRIISTHLEKNTDEVIDYLIANNIDFERINYEDFHSYSLLLGSDNKEKRFIHWHRRGRINFNPKADYHPILKKYILSEEKVLSNSYEKLNDKNYFGSYVQEEQHNKIVDLQLATQVGLKIPKTIVTNNKKDLICFYTNNKKIITKALNYSFSYNDDDIMYSSPLTVRVNKKDIDNLSDFFLPAIFQEEIKKQFEIRVFYFKTRFFPMAIFSQNDSKTKLDFRNYNFQKPNRTVPFKLPTDLKKNLLKFIKKKKSNTGSIDLIYTKNNEFVFLEDNPMGQYDWVSKYCNFYVEEFIYKNLTNAKNF